MKEHELDKPHKLCDNCMFFTKKNEKSNENDNESDDAHDVFKYMELESAKHEEESAKIIIE